MNKTLLKTLKRHWLQIAVWLFILLPAGSFLLASAGLMIYIHWPAIYSEIDFPRPNSNHKHMRVLAHGLKDDTTGWVEQLDQLYNERGYDSETVQLDWSSYAGSTLRCAINGQRIGKRIGREIVIGQTVGSVHLIGHSCGAFVIYGICQSIKEHNRNITVQTTYLDPVSIYGMFWDYGLNRFGSCADYSDAYIDTGDDVPGSNQLLPNTHTYDVTRARKQSDGSHSPHYWPTVYYRQLVASMRAPEYHNNPHLIHEKPRGVLEIVE